MLISKEFALKLHEGITVRGLCGFSFVSSSSTRGNGFGTAACVAHLRAPQQGGQRHKGNLRRFHQHPFGPRGPVGPHLLQQAGEVNRGWCLLQREASHRSVPEMEAGIGSARRPAATAV